MGLSSQESVGCHALLQGIFPIQGLNVCLLHWQEILHLCSTWEALQRFSITQTPFPSTPCWRTHRSRTTNTHTHTHTHTHFLSYLIPAMLWPQHLLLSVWKNTDCNPTPLPSSSVWRWPSHFAFVGLFSPLKKKKVNNIQPTKLVWRLYKKISESVTIPEIQKVLDGTLKKLDGQKGLVSLELWELA